MLLDIIDVFGSGALSGNPLAVVRGWAGLSDAAMQRLTDWLGFSETTFLMPPTDPAADYRVRIFCPGRELPFAGHPTLGTCHAWLAAGGVPKQAGTIVQQCGIGLVEVRQDGTGMLAFRAPPTIRDGPLSAVERAEAIRIAGVDPDSVVDAVHASNGPGWQLLRLGSSADVLAAQPAARAPIGTDVALIAPCLPGGGADFEVRAFFANGRGDLAEDPVTGSLHAAAARYLFGAGLAQGSYVAAQGRMVGADGRVLCSQDAEGAVWIGGRTVMVAAGAQLTV